MRSLFFLNSLFFRLKLYYLALIGLSKGKMHAYGALAAGARRRIQLNKKSCSRGGWLTLTSSSISPIRSYQKGRQKKMATATKPLKGLSCIILKNASMGDSSNGGISSRFESVVLVGEGIPEISTAQEGEAVIIGTVIIGAKTYYHAVPKDLHDKNEWTMSGGTFIWASDSRFPFPYPLALHDRVE